MFKFYLQFKLFTFYVQATKKLIKVKKKRNKKNVNIFTSLHTILFNNRNLKYQQFLNIHYLFSLAINPHIKLGSI